MFTRTRYQQGTLKRIQKRRRGEDVWEFRYYDFDANGRRGRRAVMVGSVTDYPTESAARKAPIVQSILLRVNAEQPQAANKPAAFGAVLARYQEEEMPERHSTRAAYQSYINNHIRPRWEDVALQAIKPMPVEAWLKGLDLAPKTRAHIRGLMHTVFTCAERWELIESNPIALVRVKGGSKRGVRPSVLTVDQFHLVLDQLAEPYRTMALLAGCLGLRISEIMGLQWSDFDFESSILLIQRGSVHSKIDLVKTEYSQDHVPLNSALKEALLLHRTSNCFPTAEGWVFASPRTGRPLHQDTIQQDYLRPAGQAIGLEQSLGWHTFRHSYRSWLDEIGAPMSVQKELMRHASIQTTMNIYGRAMTETKRQANSKVVEMVFRPASKAKHENFSKTPQKRLPAAIGS